MSKDEKKEAKENIQDSLQKYSAIQDKFGTYIEQVRDGDVEFNPEEHQEKSELAETVLTELRKIDDVITFDKIQVDVDMKGVIYKQQTYIQELCKLAKKKAPNADSKNL